MIARLGTSPSSLDKNLLPSGDFEDIDTQAMVDEGWQHTQEPLRGVRAEAELALTSPLGNYALRLAAVPETNTDAPTVVDRRLVSVTTPAMTVHKGQILLVTGKVRIITPITASIDGVTLSDNLFGPVAALRWQRPDIWRRPPAWALREQRDDSDEPNRRDDTRNRHAPRSAHDSRWPAAWQRPKDKQLKENWERFEIIREVAHSGEYRLTISLHGLGEIQFDDLKVVALDAPQVRDKDPSASTAETGQRSRPGALDFLPRLPKLIPLQPKR